MRPETEEIPGVSILWAHGWQEGWASGIVRRVAPAHWFEAVFDTVLEE